MKTFCVDNPNQGLRTALVDKINNLTKPKGSLGQLEELALQLGLIQQTLSPTLQNPVCILFAADHGIESEGVSLSPRCITWQQMRHFNHGGAGINFLCRQHGFDLRLVDAGVDYDFPPDTAIIDRKIAKGTRNYLYEDAMTREELDKCLIIGAEEVEEINLSGSNVLAIGEMGIANTSASSLWMSCIGHIPLIECVGSGSGFGADGIRHKYEVLLKALRRFEEENKEEAKQDPIRVMEAFGGYEMVMAVGAMLRAAELNMVILVDGFIMSACILLASRLCPAVLDYAVFGHTGDEAGHKRLLDLMNARPLLSLGLKLGEGSGAVCAYPILESSVRMLQEMDSFSDVLIDKYF